MRWAIILGDWSRWVLNRWEYCEDILVKVEVVRAGLLECFYVCEHIYHELILFQIKRDSLYLIPISRS